MDGSVSKKHLEEACAKYGIGLKDLTFAGGMENAVYSFRKEDQKLFLRIGQTKHMSTELVNAEIDWVIYLLDKKVPAVRPVKSDKGVIVEVIGKGRDSYNVVAFEEAEGEQLDFRNPKSWQDSVIRDWGKTIGRIHSVTKDYNPKSSRRYEFHPELDLHLVKKDSKAKRRIGDLFERMHELPKTRDSYGLVHSDLHAGNFFVKADKISTILDFDRACYKWFISEVAIALYYPLYVTELRKRPHEQKEYASRFLPLFLEGYSSENKLDSSWLEYLSLFMQVRDAILYMYIPPTVPAEWKASFRRRILGEDTYADIQFEDM